MLLISSKSYSTTSTTTTTTTKSTAENFDARLKQDKLISKTDFDNKLVTFNRRITSNEKNI